mgnify:CR=1 FL=1
MALSRYSFSAKKTNSEGKQIVGISSANHQIFDAVEAGIIGYSVHVLEEGERLDYLAGINYGDSSLWWILAAASGIGYALQVPPGTIIRIPTSITEVFGVLV